ncbi:MAG: hypothetical protein JNG84_14390 [Archangium sp.]|nr:hypothetical protein [Archangium sp.]
MNLRRAGLLGLVGGLSLAALFLVGSAVVRLRVECADHSQEECTLETQLARDIARTQALAALGLGCIAGGLALFQRRRSAGQ